jgi:hypothetical protein
MVFEVGGKLLKEYDDEGYKRAFNQGFTGFPKDLGFNNGLSAPQPDFVEGLEMQEYDPFPVDEHVKGDPFFFAILLNTAKFFRVSRARFSWRSLSSPSLSICRFGNRVAREACPCPSILGSGREVPRRFGGLGFGA